MSRIVPLPTSNTVVDDTVSIINADGTVASFAPAAATYATTTSRIPSAAATTNATSAKAAAGYLYGASGYNAAAAVRYLKFYNKASAPTVGTDVPVLTIALAPSAAFSFNFGSLYFSTGIAYAMTTGAADADTGALTLADVVGLNVVYT